MVVFGLGFWSYWILCCDTLFGISFLLFSTRIMLTSFCIRSLLTTISLISSIKWAEIQRRMNYYKGAPSTSRKRANCTSVRIEPRTKRQPCLNAAKNERKAKDIYVLRQPSHPKSQDDPLLNPEYPIEATGRTTGCPHTRHLFNARTAAAQASISRCMTQGTLLPKEAYSHRDS